MISYLFYLLVLLFTSTHLSIWSRLSKFETFFLSDPYWLSDFCWFVYCSCVLKLYCWWWVGCWITIIIIAIILILCFLIKDKKRIAVDRSKFISEEEKNWMKKSYNVILYKWRNTCKHSCSYSFACVYFSNWLTK